MLVTCRYCGRIHDRLFDCGHKPVRKRKRGYIRGDKKEAAFRRSEAWKRKSIEIRNRDHFLCQVCLRGQYQYGERRTLNYDDLSVHHIHPLKDDWDDRLNNNNLITLCSLHHEMAERGEISAKELEEIVREGCAGT